MLESTGVSPYAINTQPGTLGAPPGSTPVKGVTVRHLRDTLPDAEFASRLTVEAFRGKLAHNVTERKLPILVRNYIVNHQGQPEAFYRRTFVAELEGNPVGLIQLKFHADREPERDDHLSELGCWHGCRYLCFECVLAEDIKVGKCYVSHICVEASARGKGVGKLLLERAEYEARLRNCKVIFLFVLTDNQAKNLYEREGYRIKGTFSCCGLLGCCVGPPGEGHEMEKPL